MEEWKTYRLEDLTIDGKGHYGIGASAVDYDENKFTYLRITDINDDGSINYSGLKSVDDPEASKYLLKEGDIVFARTGNSTGRSYYYESSDGLFVFAGFLIKFSLDPAKVNPRFLKYYTHSKTYYEWVQSFDTGATRGNINAQTYGSMEIKLPPREVQDRLVEILRAMDDKIKLNTRINHNLEVFLDAKYDEIINKSSQSVSLSEIADRITDGAHNTVLDSPEDSYYLLSCKNLKGGKISIGNSERKIDIASFQKLRQRTKLGKWDILLSSVGTIGEIVLLKDDPAYFEFQRSVAMIKVSRFSPFIVYSALRRQRSELIHAAHGAVQQCLFLSDIGNFDLTVPDDKTDILEFSKLSEITHTMISEREKENAELVQLRDMILPMLISGEFMLKNERS